MGDKLSTGTLIEFSIKQFAALVVSLFVGASVIIGFGYSFQQGMIDKIEESQEQIQNSVEEQISNLRSEIQRLDDTDQATSERIRFLENYILRGEIPQNNINNELVP